MDTSRHTWSKEKDKGWRAQPTGPRVTNRPPEGTKSTPTGQIDLTGESPSMGAPPSTPTQGEGRADPKGQGEAQEEGEQLECDQEDP